MLKGKVSIILLIIVSVLFIVGATRFSGKAEAQLNGFGSQCVRNYGDCPAGKYNLLNLADNASQYLDLNQESFINSISDTYGDNANKVCVNQEYTNFTVRYLTNSELKNFPNQNLNSIGSNNDQQIIPRACPQGWTAQEAPHKITTFVGYSTGCCPTDFKFVNVAQESSAEAYINGVCCRVGSGLNPTKWDPNPTSGGCQDESGNVIIPNTSQKASHTSSFEEALNSVNQGNIIVGIKSTGSGYTTDLSEFSFSDGGIIKPQLGLGLGQSYPANNVSLDGTMSGSDFKCASKGCAVVNNVADNQFVPYTKITSSGKDYFIISTEALDSNTLSCQKCFTNNEAMFIEDENTNPENKQQLITCDTGSTNFINRTDLINNSVADTLAYINASQNLDKGNADFIAQCRASGGIPTAIGCLDPSPLGIITGLIRIALGVVGGVALLELILVGIQYQRGDEEGVKKARERLIATLTGVAVLIFSVLILRILGVNVLDILPSGSV